LEREVVEREVAGRYYRWGWGWGLGVGVLGLGVGGWGLGLRFLGEGDGGGEVKSQHIAPLHCRALIRLTPQGSKVNAISDSNQLFSLAPFPRLINATLSTQQRQPPRPLNPHYALTRRCSGGSYLLASLVLDGLLLRALPALVFGGLMYPMVSNVLG